MGRLKALQKLIYVEASYFGTLFLDFRRNVQACRETICFIFTHSHFTLL